MKLLKFSIFITAVFALVQCQSNADFTIEGTIAGINDNSIYFEKSAFGEPIESMIHTDLDESGHFKIEMKSNPGPGKFRLRTGSRTSQIVLDGNEHYIKFNTDANSFSKNTYDVTGSAGAMSFNTLMKDQYSNKLDVEGIRTFIRDTENPYTAQAYAEMFLKTRVDFVSFHEEIAQRLKKKYPNEEHKTYDAYINQMNAQLQARQASAKIRVGQPAPEIVMDDPEGNSRKLSDLKGKVVLIDFWASWCGPCRRANPKVVQVYNKYKDKGFDVFSVSLDGMDERSRKRYNLSEQQYEQRIASSKSRWLAAIEKDQLTWDNHVSDLKKWDTPAAHKYGVTGIPKTFLIDREGKIAAVNPRFNLEEELKKLL